MSYKDIDETTELLRRSIVVERGNKHCIKDFSGEVFELTEDMLVKDRLFDEKQAKEYSGIAECILKKYDKLLSLN